MPLVSSPSSDGHLSRMRRGVGVLAWMPRRGTGDGVMAESRRAIYEGVLRYEKRLQELVTLADALARAVETMPIVYAPREDAPKVTAARDAARCYIVARGTA